MLKINSKRSGYPDVNKYGVPINELDSMQFVCAFSTNLIWLFLPANDLVVALDGVAAINEPSEFFEAGTRYINGNQMCDDIGLGKPGLYSDAVVRGQYWALMTTTYLARSIPAWSEFKYVPHEVAQTRAETHDGPRPEGSVCVFEMFGLASFAIAMILVTVFLTMAARLATKCVPFEPHIMLESTSFLKR